MFQRRNFLKTSLLGSLLIVLDKNNVYPAPLFRSVKNKPLVISTWDFGRAANAEAWNVLTAGGQALDAVERGARVIEADPTINTVGYGGLPDRDGHVTLDACIMNEKGGCGSVMCIENIMHPVSVARLVMEKTPHVILSGEGAQKFAIENGFQKQNLLTPESEKLWREWLKTSNYQPVINIENGGKVNNQPTMPLGPGYHDTIGILAIDANGDLCGACTTSGLAFKMRGRVGDSPVIGAGLFVDNEIGAATSTGVGEEVIRIAGSHLVVELMRQGNAPEKACKAAVERIIKKNPAKAKTLQVGFLALNKKGEYGGYALQKGFTFCIQKNSDGSKEVMAKSAY